MQNHIVARMTNLLGNQVFFLFSREAELLAAALFGPPERGVKGKTEMSGLLDAELVPLCHAHQILQPVTAVVHEMLVVNVV